MLLNIKYWDLIQNNHMTHRILLQSDSPVEMVSELSIELYSKRYFLRL